VRKIREPEGFCILIEDFTRSRYELHVYRLFDMAIYVSPKIRDMSEEDGLAFVIQVNQFAMLPPSWLKKVQWWSYGG